MTRRYRLVRRAARIAAAFTAAALVVAAMTAAAYVGDARRCEWLRAHDPITAHTYECEATR